MYSIKVSEEAKFKFNEVPQRIVYEQDEESKSLSSDSHPSSLITEEDTSGNPLPPEIIEIRRKNKQLQKNLTNGLMNYKSTSRSLIESEVSQQSEEEKKSERLESGEKKDTVKGALEKILKLNAELVEGKKKIIENKNEIFTQERVFLELSRDLGQIEEELKTIAESKKVVSKCSCEII